MKQLFSAASPTVREMMVWESGLRLKRAVGDENRERAADLFAFHPQSAEIHRELAQADIAEGRLFDAELRLLRLLDAELPGPSPATAALRNQLTDRCGWTSGVPQAPSAGAVPSWGEIELTPVRSGSYLAFDRISTLTPLGQQPAALRQLTLHYNETTARVVAQSVSNPGQSHTFPLRGGQEGTGAPAVVHAVGHHLVLLSGRTVQAVSPWTGEVLWALQQSADAAAAARRTSRGPMRPAGSFASNGSVIAQTLHARTLPAANAHYTLVVDSGHLTALDSRTGIPLWIRAELPAQVQILGTRSLIYLISAQGGEALVLDADTGRRVTLPAIPTLERVVAVAGDNLLTVTAEGGIAFFGIRTGQAVVKLTDPRTERVMWSKSFDMETLFDITDDGRLALLTGEGKLLSLDVATGEARTLGIMPQRMSHPGGEVSLWTSAAGTTVFANRFGHAAGYSSSEVPSRPVNGMISHFGSVGGEPVWQREVRALRWFDRDAAQMPVLLFFSAEMVEKAGGSLWRIDLLALDRLTGEVRLEAPLYSAYPAYFSGMAIDSSTRTIDLYSYNARLRLQSVPRAEK